MQELTSTPDLSTDSGDGFIGQLDNIAQEDAAGLKKAQLSYGNSWKQRGGVGAFMMLARKWDRLEQQLKKDVIDEENLSYVQKYDVFGHIAADQRSEGVIDDIRDLRRYLMLVEAEMRARGFSAGHRDNAPAAKSCSTGCGGCGVTEEASMGSQTAMSDSFGGNSAPGK